MAQDHQSWPPLFSRGIHCTGMFRRCAVVWIAVFFVSAAGALAQQPPRLDELTLKGTHNSYECYWNCNIFFCHNNCPLMHHHPVQQVDDFGVYVVELDFSIELENGQLRAIVGHDGHCGDGCWTSDQWGKYLEVYFQRLRDTQSFPYRPLVVYADKKCCWGDDQYDAPAMWMPFIENLALDVFGEEGIYRYSQWQQSSGVWPPIPELAGKLVLIGFGTECQGEYCPAGFGGTGIMFPSNVLTAAGGGGDCVDPAEYQAWAQSGVDVIRDDEYQYDWTFDYVAPPNPIVVDVNSPDSFTVGNSEDPYCGSSCVGVNCNPEEFSVLAHGTFRFPFRDLNSAVARAEPGWTIRVEAGNYPTPLVISKRLTIVGHGGSVIIGE